MKKIFSKDNRFIKLARQLNQRKQREKTGLFIAEGVRSLEDVLRSDYTLQAILINSVFKTKTEAKRLLSKVDKSVPLMEVEDSLFQELALTENTQGVMVIIRQKKHILETFLTSSPQFIVVADSVQDPGNLGTIIRTTAAAGASCLVVTKGSVDIYNPKVVRASMGGIFFLPVLSVENSGSFVELLKLNGYRIVVGDLEGQIMYYEADLKQPVALVIGNENSGPSQLFKKNADLIIKIPMLGDVESLNAGVAAGILIYDAVRQNFT
jgi:TrmH family RNA methyltransferase